MFVKKAWWLRNEAGEFGDTGGGGFDMESAVSSIGADLGFGSGDDGGSGDTGDITDDVSGITGTDDTAAIAAGGEGGKPAEAPADATETGATPAATPAAEAPKTWRPEAAAKWASLDPQVQQEILKREADIFKGLEGYKAEATVGKSFNQALEPFRPLLTQHNIDPVQLTTNLMQAHAVLSLGAPEQKVEYMRQLAQSYGIDLGQVGAEAPYVDPEVARLRDELNSVKSNLTAQQQRQQDELRQKVMGEIDAFAKDPAHPYFDEVANDITRLLKTGMDLKEAYEKAVWANPVTRAKELERETAERTRKAQEEAKTKAEAARKAAAANVKVRAKQASGTAPLGSIDETLKEAYRKATSAGE